MRSKTQGLMAHLLMFLPLLAVPFVASFGVPWLAAKAKEEGLPLPQFIPSSDSSTGVGESNTARRSADDLFAPILQEAEVDLKLAPSGAPPAQNPHLRSASLVVSRDEPWVDPFENIPFENINAEAPAPRDLDRSAEIAREQALADWAVKTQDEFGPPEPSKPIERPAARVEDPPPASANPFALMEASASAGEPARSQVPVEDSAFEDPAPRPPTNRGAREFEPSRTLFAEANTPSAPERPIIREPQAPAPATREVEPGTPAADSPQGLTWETARERLKTLGIKDYYLQPDSENQVFLFRCAYTPPNNPRINRLFEAEAADALEAVQKVIEQVEAWKNTSAGAQ